MNRLCVLLILSGFCSATEIARYVRIDGSNSNSGTSNDTDHAWLTIQYAIDTSASAISAGDTAIIYVDSGTYSADTYIHFDGTNNGKHFIINGSGSIDEQKTTISLSHQTLGIYYFNAFAGGNVTFKDCEIISSGALNSGSGGFFRVESTMANREGCFLKFHNVIMGNGSIPTQQGLQLCSGIDLIIENGCRLDFPTGGLVSCIFAPNGMGDLTITDSHIDYNGTAPAIQPKGDFGSIVLRNSSLKSSGNGLYYYGIIDMSLIASAETAYLDSVDISISGIKHNGILIPYYFKDVHLNKVTITNTSPLDAGMGIEIGFDGETNPHPIGRTRIYNCKVTHTIDGAHGLLVGSGADNYVISNTHITMPAGNDGANLGFVIKAKNGTIINSSAIAERSLYFKSDADENHVSNCYFRATGGFAGSCAIMWGNTAIAGVDCIPSFNSIRNCLLDQGDGDYVLYLGNAGGSPATATGGNGCHFDFNIYSGDILLRDGTNRISYTTLAELQGFWDAQGYIYGTSGDDNSKHHAFDRTGLYIDMDGDGNREWVGIPQSSFGNGSVSTDNCINPPFMDSNGDCKVDFIDFCAFASEWLSCGLENQSACWE
ncbi:MAG TPA: hypothetical protein PKB02_02480 [Anaerohalosphaeraceae bacterium]|nr:hypothetical protein [Anaerohalosphaeraceae bacterium]